MPRSHYDVLGVPRLASDAIIRREYRATLERITADTSLTAGQREAALREVENAWQTLSSPAARDAYDARIHRLDEGGAGASGASTLLRSPLLWGTVALALLGIGLGVVQYQREQTRQRVERERVASEQAEERRQRELDERRERERKRLQEEIRAQKEAEENQRQIAAEARQADMKEKQFVADDRYIPPQQQQINIIMDRAVAGAQSVAQRQQQYEQENSLRQARAEAERQKRYVEQREREEEYARYRRDAAARYR